MSDQEQEQYDPNSTAGLPEHGRERLERMKGSGFFTSDLSVNEFLLVKEAGFDPLGLVIGSSIYHVGFQMGNWSRNQEMDVLSQAMYSARDLAMTRMEEEADQLGADGIVGVHLKMQMYAWGQDVLEFVATGTAVRALSANGAHRTPAGRAFTSDLSAQDFYRLLATGSVRSTVSRKPDNEARAEMSAGSSNLGSWVKTSTASRGPRSTSVMTS